MSVYIGVMSGTSLDGLDVAAVSFEGEDERPRGVESLAFRSSPYDPAFRDLIRGVIDDGSAEAICDLDFRLGRAIGAAVLEVLDEAGLGGNDVRAVGCHGQTVWHRPPEPGHPGSTLQLGNASVIAETTGIDVVSGFRDRDMAVGGHGAPLTGYTDALLFGGREARVILNVGGMANLTALPASGASALPQAFDTGPGVALIDGAVRRLSGGEQAYDVDGRLASTGRIDEAALDDWLSDPFFAAPPPKSTGREHFSEPRLARWLEDHEILPQDDLVATLTELTARTISDGFRWVDPVPAACFLCGGGARNRTLVDRIANLLSPIPVRGLAELGVDPDAREAIAFALLARQHVLGIPANAPWATGASGPRVLGSRTPA